MFGLNEIHPAVQKFEYLLTKADAAVAIIYRGKIVVAVYVQYKSSSKTVHALGIPTKCYYCIVTCGPVLAL